MAELPPYGEWKVPADMPEIRGLFVGGCVARGVGSSFRRMAHAHNHRSSEHFGWVCVRSKHRVYIGDDLDAARPTRLMWHEYAHILCPNHGHDDLWRATMRRLGQPIPAHYKKKVRS